MTVIDKFEIPTELAQRLTDLMTTESIREKLLISLMDQPDKYEKMESKLAEVVTEINQIKNTITENYVPDIYRFERYNWNYNGMYISGNIVDILEA